MVCCWSTLLCCPAQKVSHCEWTLKEPAQLPADVFPHGILIWITLEAPEKTAQPTDNRGALSAPTWVVTPYQLVEAVWLAHWISGNLITWDSLSHHRPLVSVSLFHRVMRKQIRIYITSSGLPACVSLSSWTADSDPWHSAYEVWLLITTLLIPAEPQLFYCAQSNLPS